MSNDHKPMKLEITIGEYKTIMEALDTELEACIDQHNDDPSDDQNERYGNELVALIAKLAEQA